MKFKPGDLVWAAIHRRELNLHGEYAGVVVGFRGMRRYLVEIDGIPCPYTYPRVPAGLWTGKEQYLRPRRPPDIQKQDWVKLCKLKWFPKSLVEG